MPCNPPWYVVTDTGDKKIFPDFKRLVAALALGLNDDVQVVAISRSEIGKIQSRKEPPRELEEKLAPIYEVLTGTGESLGLFKAVSYCDAPTFKLEDATGATRNWREDLCSVATQEQTVEFWRSRAEYLERNLRGRS